MGWHFSCTTSTAAESSAMTGTCPGSPSPCFSPDGQIGVVVLTNRRRCSARHRLAEASLRSGLGLPPADSRLPRPDVPEARISEARAFHERPLAQAATGRQAPPSGEMIQGASRLNADGTSLDARGSLVMTFTGAPRIYFPSIERRGSIELMVVHQGPGSLCCSSGARCCHVDTAHDLGPDNEAIGRLGCQPHG
jgi:hypothetical protein